MDRVVSGENWSIGGDNATKDTAQRITNGWLTAAPTPRAANAENSANNNPPASEQSSSSSSQNSSQTTSAEKPPEIKVEIIANRTAIVGADALFSGKALGADGKPLDNVRFLWNFGDGETKEGQNVLHRFRFPGEYVVILDIAYGKWSSAARLTAIAIKSPLIISRVEKGAAGLVELTKRRRRVGLVRLASPVAPFLFTFPKTPLLRRQNNFSNEVTNLELASFTLYPNGVWRQI